MIVISICGQADPLNRYDHYGKIRMVGYELAVMPDHSMITVGASADTSAHIGASGFLLAHHAPDGEVIADSFFYSDDHIYFVNLLRNIVVIDSSHILYCYRGSEYDCYIYDTASEEIAFLNIVENIDHPHKLVPVVLEKLDSTIFIILNQTFDEHRFAILKYRDDEFETIVFPAEENSINSYRDFVVISESEQYVFLLLSGDEYEFYMYHIVDDEIVSKTKLPQGVSNSVEFTEAGDFIYCTGTGITEDGITYYTPILSMMDRSGEVIWTRDMRDLMTPTNVSFQINYFTDIRKLIPTADPDEYLYVGTEYISEDTIRYGYGIIGKINTEGEVIWHNRYHNLDENGYKHVLQDIEHDGYGGYVAYGQIINNSSFPWQFAGWLLRIDADGNLVDDSVNTAEILKEELGLMIYPNPTLNYIYTNKDLCDVKIIDQLGEIVISINSLGRYEELDMGILSTGAYFMRGLDNNGKLWTAMFSKH